MNVHLYQGDTPKNKIPYADCQFGKKHYICRKKNLENSIMQKKKKKKTNKNASLIHYYK